MKIKRLTIMLLTAAMLTSCLLPLTGCKKGETTPEKTFAVDGTPSIGSEQSKADPDTGWDSSQLRGDKILYGKEESSDGSILRWGNMLIGVTTYSNCYGYFSFDKPNEARLICFDPLCLHLPNQESCPAVTNLYLPMGAMPGEGVAYPTGMYLDLYESTEAPVIYFYYRRADFYRINLEEGGYRDPVYCIERYDLSQGKRYVLLDNVENTILQVCNYGDYVYYVLDMGDSKGQELYRIHKSGGQSDRLDLEEKAESIRIADAIDDRFYYILNEKSIYRSDLDLSDSEMVLDMSTVKGQNDSNGVIAGSYSGYLYYFADVETVWAGTPDESESTPKANLYRIPMSDLSKSPEKVVEGMIYSNECYRFTEKTLYYVPCVFKIDNSEGGDTAINTCDGKLFALDLKTGETKTIVENSGMTIYPKYAWDDIVTFTGWAYNKSGEQNAGGNSNLLLAYTSDEPYKVWCRVGEVGDITDEYYEELQGK